MKRKKRNISSAQSVRLCHHVLGIQTWLWLLSVCVCLHLLVFCCSRSEGWGGPCNMQCGVVGGTSLHHL